jgi:hypothetical protein
MKISQLITELQKLQAEHGDLPVTTSGSTGDHDETSGAHLDDGTFFDETYGRHKGPHIHLS